MRQKLIGKAIGTIASALTVLGTGDNPGLAIAATPQAGREPLSIDEKPLLFIDSGTPEAAEYLLAAHRSHSSHRSHYSSRGGGYSSPAPIYSPPTVSTPPSSPPTTRAAPAAAVGTSALQQTDLIKGIQENLLKLGYAPGVANGKLEKETQKAIAMFQADQGLKITGEPSQALLQTITLELQKKKK